MPLAHLLACLTLTGTAAGAPRASIHLDTRGASGPVAERVQRELELLNLEVREPPQAPSATTAVGLSMSFVMSESTRVVIRLRIERTGQPALVREAEVKAHGASELAVMAGIRAAELVRASLAEVSLSSLLVDDAAPSKAAEHPPAKTPLPPAREQAGDRARLVLDIGPTLALAGSERAALAGAFSVGYGPRAWRVRAAFIGPLDTELSGLEGTAEVRQVLVQAELVWSPLARLPVGPHAWVGAGSSGFWLRGVPAGAAYAGLRERALLLTAGVGIGLEWRVSSWLSFRAENRWLTTWPRPRVEHSGRRYELAAPNVLAGTLLQVAL